MKPNSNNDNNNHKKQLSFLFFFEIRYERLLHYFENELNRGKKIFSDVPFFLLLFLLLS